MYSRVQTHSYIRQPHGWVLSPCGDFSYAGALLSQAFHLQSHPVIVSGTHDSLTGHVREPIACIYAMCTRNELQPCLNLAMVPAAHQMPDLASSGTIIPCKLQGPDVFGSKAAASTCLTFSRVAVRVLMLRFSVRLAGLQLLQGTGCGHHAA